MATGDGAKIVDRFSSVREVTLPAGELGQCQPAAIGQGSIAFRYWQYINPTPPPEKQTEISNYISVLRTQAKQLQQQAAAELAHAKQHVEQLILGVQTLVCA